MPKTGGKIRETDKIRRDSSDLTILIVMSLFLERLGFCLLLLLQSLDDREVHECDMEKDAGFHESLRIEDAFLFKWVSVCNHGC